ncbi:MAG: hypothetical protein JWM28_771 [Chitinophagaceae bacterium]|nr:hypothetical protein [Chitinophagaceae bacterium]
MRCIKIRIIQFSLTEIRQNKNVDKNCLQVLDCNRAKDFFKTPERDDYFFAASLP